MLSTVFLFAPVLVMSMNNGQRSRNRLCMEAWPYRLMLRVNEGVAFMTWDDPYTSSPFLVVWTSSFTDGKGAQGVLRHPPSSAGNKSRQRKRCAARKPWTPWTPVLYTQAHYGL